MNVWVRVSGGWEGGLLDNPLSPRIVPPHELAALAEDEIIEDLVRFYGDGSSDMWNGPEIPETIAEHLRVVREDEETLLDSPRRSVPIIRDWILEYLRSAGEWQHSVEFDSSEGSFFGLFRLEVEEAGANVVRDVRGAGGPGGEARDVGR